MASPIVPVSIANTGQCLIDPQYSQDPVIAQLAADCLDQASRNYLIFLEMVRNGHQNLQDEHENFHRPEAFTNLTNENQHLQKEIEGALEKRKQRAEKPLEEGKLRLQDFFLNEGEDKISSLPDDQHSLLPVEDHFAAHQQGLPEKTQELVKELSRRMFSSHETLIAQHKTFHSKNPDISQAIHASHLLEAQLEEVGKSRKTYPKQVLVDLSEKVRAQTQAKPSSHEAPS